MMQTIQLVLFVAALVGLALLGVQLLALRRHARAAPLPPSARPRGRPPGVSVLKPLCGVDDDLAANLLAFAILHHPRYEVLLGVKDVNDPAYPVARSFAARFPHLRVVLQRGTPGMNPKVNQLITLAAAARHDILVVSDSNVRVSRDYLDEIAERLSDPAVGIVTHAIAGGGEERLGSLLDNLHLCGAIGPGVVAAKKVAGQDIVVGKSMAMRRRDLDALGGFPVVKDVLAEDYFLGRLFVEKLGLRVDIASQPILNVSQRRTFGDFLARYRRWGVIHRKAVSPLAYAGEPMLNPVFLAALALLAHPAAAMLGLAAAVCAVKIAIDRAAAAAMGRRGFGSGLLAVPLKDLVMGVIWIESLFREHVTWRGKRLRVLRGTLIDGAGAGPVTEAIVCDQVGYRRVG